MTHCGPAWQEGVTKHAASELCFDTSGYLLGRWGEARGIPGSGSGDCRSRVDRGGLAGSGMRAVFSAGRRLGSSGRRGGPYSCTVPGARRTTPEARPPSGSCRVSGGGKIALICRSCLPFHPHRKPVGTCWAGSRRDDQGAVFVLGEEEARTTTFRRLLLHMPGPQRCPVYCTFVAAGPNPSRLLL